MQKHILNKIAFFFRGKLNSDKCKFTLKLSYRFVWSIKTICLKHWLNQKEKQKQICRKSSQCNIFKEEGLKGSILFSPKRIVFQRNNFDVSNEDRYTRLDPVLKTVYCFSNWWIKKNRKAIKTFLTLSVGQPSHRHRICRRNQVEEETLEDEAGGRQPTKMNI